MKKIVLFGICVLTMLLLFNCVYAEASIEKTYTLEENLRITSDYDLKVPADTILIINGNNLYYIYEMGGRLINTGEGSVVFENTILYPLSNDADSKKVYMFGKWDADESTRLLLERNNVHSPVTLPVASGGNLSYVCSVTNLENGCSYNFSAISTTEISGTFIVALYDDDNMLVGLDTSVMPSGTSHIINSEEIETTATAATYKVMFWNELDGLIPISGVVKGNVITE